MKNRKQRQQAVDDKANCLEMNERKNKIVIFRILISRGGGGDEIYMDVDVVTKFWNEANEWRNAEKKSTSGMGSVHEAEEYSRQREIHVGV
jgi:hypothetical protein